MKNIGFYLGIIKDLTFGAARAFLIGFIAAVFISALPGGTEHAYAAFIIVSAISFVMMLFAPRQIVMGITANYAGSDLALAQMKLNAAFANPEMRAIKPMTFAQFVRGNVNISTPDVNDVRTREDRTLAQYYLSRSYRALGTGRDHLPTGVTSTSNLLTPSFITYNDKFSISQKQADNNVYGFDEMMGHELVNTMKNFDTGNESNATSYLLNNRSAFNTAVADGSFNPTNDVFEISGASLSNQIGMITSSMMDENLWAGYPLLVFCDSISFNQFRFLAAQGATNATNTAFQFNNMTFIKSLDLTASAVALGYTKGFWIAVPDGTIAVYNWIPKQNRDGLTALPEKYGVVMNPADGLTYAVYSWYQPYNSTSVGGYTQDILYNYELSQDLAFESAPLDRNAGETVMYACALV